MKDERFTKLANLLVGYSTSVKRNDRVLIDVSDIPDEFVVELIRSVRAAGAYPFVNVRRPRIGRELMLDTDTKHASIIRDVELFQMKKMNAYIALRGSANANETADVPPKQLKIFSKTMLPVMDYRVNKTRWCVLRWPSPSMAQQAGMSTEAFENFYFDVCTMNYPAMSRAMRPLQRLMQKTDKVRILSPGTDLSFSIKKIPAICCRGDFNIPDGEVFTAPVKTSVNGVITYNAPSVYQGMRFENVRLVFKEGKIVEASSSNSKRLNEILNTDPGARYVGEFAIGFNPHIMNPMGDILFDEKIAGSFHFTPGQAYEMADNGNRSAVHWDLVLIQRPEWGGGEIYFDGKLIRKDGKFVIPELKGLNRERLLKA
ncbi:MAG: aminopeptidase [Oligoflexia bacterium]|nr:aminopeptidase [Oligoflexia bacterium]